MAVRVSGRTVEVCADRDVRHGELVVHQPLALAEDLLERRDRLDLRVAHRAAPHAVVARDGAEAEAVELRVGPYHPLCVLCTLLGRREGVATVLVRNVHEDRS
eukprot:scaffold4670_cov97-Isochrysis_galbana.AAC.4